MNILIDENKRAYGVRFRRNGRVQTALAKREVIISSGAINSPQLLMLSGIGPAQHLHEMGIPVIKVFLYAFIYIQKHGMDGICFKPIPLFHSHDNDDGWNTQRALHAVISFVSIIRMLPLVKTYKTTLDSAA